jgi:hypothetical protein
MNVDLPPSSAFIPDPAVAQVQTTRDTLTLALPLEHGEVRNPHELIGGNIGTDSVSAHGDGSLRTGIAPAEDMVSTITF